MKNWVKEAKIYARMMRVYTEKLRTQIKLKQGYPCSEDIEERFFVLLGKFEHEIRSNRNNAS